MTALPQFQSQTATAIEAARLAADERGYDDALRASTIGEECERRLWYAFRWARPVERHSGRMLRLFDTGNVEEGRLIADLRRAGFEVDAVDPETGKQFEVVFHGGHFTGHTDGQVAGIPEAPKTTHLLECKSHNEKSFAALKRYGVQQSKPVHYAQMQVYMGGRRLTRALYVAVNKNDDEIWTERVEFDPVFAAQLTAKAERIISANAAPAKLHEDPAARMAWQCGYCPARGVCHGGDWSPRNCRTCLFAAPRLDGDARWSCERHRRDLSPKDQKAGCADHIFLPDLVPGEQFDASGPEGWVDYRLADGSVWRDGAHG